MMHVVSINWRRKDDAFETGLTFWNEETEGFDYLNLTPGLHLSWLIDGPKRCIGYVDESRKSKYCPEKSTVLSTRNRCGPCSVLDFYDPCIRCDGSDCQASEERWNSCKNAEYVVYLAIFGEMYVKVGVSTAKRIQTRWVEQGADFGVEVAKLTNGMKARKIEHTIGKLKGVQKQVRVSSKATMLFDKYDLIQAHDLVMSTMENARGFDFDINLEIFDFSKFYNFQSVVKKPFFLYKRKDPVAGRKILGKIIGMKGSLLVTDLNDSYMVTDLRTIIGHSIIENNEISIETQSSLEGFF